MLPAKPLSLHSNHTWSFPKMWKHLCPAFLLLMICAPRSMAQSVPPPAQGIQTDAAFAASFKSNHVNNVFATTQRVSCYTPEVPYAGNLGPTDGYTGETLCGGSATTGENLGPTPRKMSRTSPIW
jgi:hypothetical protein